MIIRCSIKPDWTLPTGQTEDEYDRAKKALAMQSAESWSDWAGQSKDFAAMNPPGWAVGIYANHHRRKENLLSAQLIGVDYDDYPDEAALLNHPIIARHALYVGHTPSHGLPFRINGSRLRVVFCLDSAIDKPTDDKSIFQRYELAVLALLFKLPSGYDESCKDAARFFFGCKDIIQSYPAHILPMADIYKWHGERTAYDIQPAQPPMKPTPPPDSTDRKREYADKKLTNFIGNLAMAQKGTRNDTLNSIAVQVYGLVKEGALDQGTAESAMRQTALNIGLKDNEITATLKSAYNKADVWDLSGFDQQAQQKAHLADVPVTAATELKAAASMIRQTVLSEAGIEPATIKRMIGDLQKLLPNCKPEPAVSAAAVAIKNREYILSRIGKDPLEGTFKSGLPKLDKAVMGLRPRWMYTLYGAPGMGKSTLAATITSELITQAPGLIVSTESHRDDWYMKLVAFRTGIPIDRLFNGDLSPHEAKRVIAVSDEFERERFEMIPMIAPTLQQIEDQIANGRYPYQWLVVDSLNKMNVPGANGIYDRTVEASSFLQRVARDYNLMVICTSQIVRDISKRSNKMPMPEDAYGGAAVQQDSDVIVSLYYHQYYVALDEAESLPEFPEGVAIARVLKSRWTAGNSGLRLKFTGGVGFYPLADEREIPPIPYRRDVDNVQQVDFLDSVPEKRKEPVYE
jgi:replicative DNA helicase